MRPPSKLPHSKTAPSQTSSLDEALNAPTRVTRTKTRAMAKAAAADEKTKAPAADEKTKAAAANEKKAPKIQVFS